MLIEELKSGNHIIKFSATWCGPCKAYAPSFEKATKDTTKAKVHHIDVDENPELVQKFGIRGVPTTICLVEGEVKLMRAGNMTSDEVSKILEEVFNV